MRDAVGLGAESTRVAVGIGRVSLLRTSALPLSVATGLSMTICAPSANAEALEAAVAKDRVATREWIREQLGNEHVMGAIRIASRDLWDELRRGIPSGDGPFLRHELAAFRYLWRMCGRSTPFGGFAGVSPAVRGDRTALRLDGTRRYGFRLDADAMWRLVQMLNKGEDWKKRVKFYANDSISRVGDRFRYAKHLPNQGAEGSTKATQGHYETIELPCDDELVWVLDQVAKGPMTIGDLATEMKDSWGLEDLQEAEVYIEDLVEHQVLLSELRVKVISADPTFGVLEKMREVHPAHPATAHLEALVGRIAHLVQGAEPDLAAAAAPAEEFAESMGMAGTHTVHVDTCMGMMDRELGPELEGKIKDVISALRVCSEKGDALADVRKAWDKRFSSEWVPLPLAVDNELGVGEALAGSTRSMASGSLLVDVPMSGAGSADGQFLTPHGIWFLRRAHEILASGQRILDLSEEDIAALDSMNHDKAAIERFGVGNISLLADESGKLVVALNQGFYGPSASRVFGRFAYLDEGILGGIGEHCSNIQKDDESVVHAELAHLMPGGMANVAARPRLSDVEIHYLGDPPDGGERVRLGLNDLLVKLESGDFVLYSKKMQKQVIPRSSNTHAYHSDGLPAYRFLNMLQVDGRGGLEFSHGGSERVLTRFPRVTYKGNILARERWAITKQEFAHSAALTGAARIRALREIREKLRIPRFVALLSNGDELLPFDLELGASVDSLVSIVKNSHGFILVEDLWSEFRPAVQGPAGPHVHELAVAIEPSGDTVEQALSPGLRITPCSDDRLFGGDSIYTRIYCGWASADEVLLKIADEVARPLVANGAALRWFFIRYGEGGDHLRIRMFGGGVEKEALPLLHAALDGMFDQARVWKIQTDTYVRETNRYGGGGLIESAEAIFWADSEYVTRTIAELGEGRSNDQRWQHAAISVHALVRAFMPDPGDQLLFYEFAARDMPDAAKRALGKKFREYRSFIGEVVSDLQAFGVPAIRVRQNTISRAVGDYASSGLPKVRIMSILLSFTHMAVNRMLPANQPAAEGAIYELLRRAVHGEIQKLKGAQR